MSAREKLVLVLELLKRVRRRRLHRQGVPIRALCALIDSLARSSGHSNRLLVPPIPRQRFRNQSWLSDVLSRDESRKYRFLP
jgi:hypothetical protein